MTCDGMLRFDQVIKIKYKASNRKEMMKPHIKVQ